MLRFLLAIFVSLYLVIPSSAQPSGKGVVSIADEDGTPTVFPWQIKFSNSSVTDNGDGTASVTIGASGGPTGSGTTNYLAKWTSASVLGDSLAFDNGQILNYGATTTGINRFTVTTDGTYGYGMSVNHTPGGIGGCDSNAILLDHYNGANGDTSGVDANCTGSGAKTGTYSGDAQKSTTSSIFGSASLISSAASGKVSYADNAGFTIGTGNFTWEWKIQITDNTQNFALASQYASGTSFQAVWYQGNAIQIYGIRGANDTYVAASWTPTNGQTYHVMLVRSASTTYTFYIDGVALTNSAPDTSLTNFTDLSAPFEVGYHQDSAMYFQGKIDEVRISNNARQSGNFTSPSGEYTATVAIPEYAYNSNGVLKAKTYTDGNNSDRLTFQVGGIDWSWLTNAGIFNLQQLTASKIVLTDSSKNLASSAITLGTMTDGKWCTYASSGTALSCTENSPSGTGDVTSVGDCADGACYDGSSDGGTYTRLYDGDSNYGAFVTANLNADRTYTFGNLALTFDQSVASASTPTFTGTNITAVASGDTATAFFGSGTIEHERGGLEADINAYDGLVGITGGSTYNQTGTTTQIIIFDGSGAPTSAALSGDVTMTNAGAVTIGANTVALTTDTTGNYAAGDAEAGAALTGDSATSFFSTGTVEGARLGTFSKSFIITGVTSSGDFGAIWKTPAAITITSVNVVQVGATNVVGQLDECDADGANCVTVDSSDITADGGNDADDGSLSNASIDANDWIGWHTTSVSGTNTRISVTFNYTVN